MTASMAINFSKIRALTAGEIIRALLDEGFVLRKGRGGVAFERETARFAV